MLLFEKHLKKNTAGFSQLIFFIHWHLCILLFIAGCQNANPGYATLKALISPVESRFDASYDYISIQSVTSNGRMILGYRQIQQGKLIEHWYTGAGEMLETADGRIYKALGTTSEIRRNIGQTPSWQAVSESLVPIKWRRSLDIMPGYRFGIEEKITTRMLTENDIPVILSIKQRGLVWYQDVVESTDIHGLPITYIQLFALKDKQIVYSEQCISELLCMHIQWIPRAVP